MNKSDTRIIVEEVMQGMASGNYAPLFNHFSEDIKWRVIGTTRFSGTLTGMAEITEKRLKPFRSFMKDPPKICAQNYICDGNTVAVEAEGTGTTRDGQAYNPSYCMIFKISNGQIIEFTEYFDTDISVKLFGRADT